MKEFFFRIVVWSETTSYWATDETVLLKGEFALEFPDSVDDGTTPIPKVKIGDGTKAFKDLPYAMYTASEIDSKLQTLTSNSHTHANKVTLDAITEAFTTELKQAYDAMAQNGVTKVQVGDGAPITASDGTVVLPAYPTKESLGLGNVSNTPDAEKSVASAGKLTTPRQIALTGGVTGSATFDGSADASIEATVQSVSADKITGKINIENLPEGALERCVVVTNAEARKALTTAEVQKGDTVKETDTGLMYFVVDDTKLDQDAGYEIYTAGGASSVPWAGITGKPEQFPPESHQHTMSDITDYVPPVVDAALSDDSTNAVQNKVIKAELDAMKEDIADLLYEPINITSFTNNVNTVEMGRTITEVTLNWNWNKEPASITLDGEAITPTSTKSKQLTDQSIKANKSFTLKATDERSATSQKTTSITFYNGVYYGVAEQGESYDSAFVLGLTKSLQGSRGKTFTVNAGAGQHIFYAVPSRYGTCGFNVGGFDGGFSKVSTFEFTNASGYAENYDLYMSDNANLGNTTVKVS